MVGITQESRADYTPSLGGGVTKRPWRERTSGLALEGPSGSGQRGIISLVSRQAPHERQSRFLFCLRNASR